MGICGSRPRKRKGADSGPSEVEEYKDDPEVITDLVDEESESPATAQESTSGKLQNSVPIQSTAPNQNEVPIQSNSQTQDSNSLQNMPITQHPTQIQEQVPLQNQEFQNKALVRIKNSQQQKQKQVPAPTPTPTQELKVNTIVTGKQEPTKAQPTISPQPQA